MSLLVLGTVALDSVKTPSGKRDCLLGGSASHFSMSARLFTDVHLVATIGEDFPLHDRDFLRSMKLNLDSLKVNTGETFKWEGEYQGSLNSAITLKTELGVLATFDPLVTEKQRGIRCVFLANTDPEIQMRLLKQMHKPGLVALDSMNFWINSKRKELLKVLKMVDIYVVNDEEARSLSGEHNLIKAGRKLRSMGPEMVLIKKGEHGAMLYSDKFIFPMPAYPVETVVDPTGAGDTFAGGFMGYLAQSGKATEAVLKEAIAYGTVAASFNVEAFGLERTSKLTIRDLRNRLSKFRKMMKF